MRVRAVLFDLGQTLLEYPGNTHEFWREGGRDAVRVGEPRGGGGERWARGRLGDGESIGCGAHRRPQGVQRGLRPFQR